MGSNKHYKVLKIRDVATPSERLCITLRYLVTGDAQATMQDMISLLLILVRLGDKMTVACIKTATWVMQLIKIYLMYLLHQMICHPTENIIHMFLWPMMPFK